MQWGSQVIYPALTLMSAFQILFTAAYKSYSETKHKQTPNTQDRLLKVSIMQVI